MSIIEFRVFGECPSCREEDNYSAEFDLSSAHESGCDSFVTEGYCNHCDEPFWFKARLDFEVEMRESYETKPKPPRKKAEGGA